MGCRQGRSSKTQLLGVTEEISHDLERELQIDLLVLDLSKAFDLDDKLDHRGSEAKIDCSDPRVFCFFVVFSARDNKLNIIMNGTRSEFLPFCRKCHKIPSYGRASFSRTRTTCVNRPDLSVDCLLMITPAITQFITLCQVHLLDAL